MIVFSGEWFTAAVGCNMPPFKADVSLERVVLLELSFRGDGPLGMMQPPPFMMRLTFEEGGVLLLLFDEKGNCGGGGGGVVEDEGEACKSGGAGEANDDIAFSGGLPEK